MALSLRLAEEDQVLFKKYAALHNISVSEMIRRAVMEKIEDELDLECYEKAKAEFDADPVTFSLEEVKKELGLV